MQNERKHGRRHGRVGGLLVALFAAVALVGCDDSSILDVTDPDLVTPESISQPELYWAGAIGDFVDAASSNGGISVYVGLFTDEFQLSGTFPTRIEVDERNIGATNGTMEGVFRGLHHARVSALNAADFIAEEEGSDPRVAEMLNLAGYTRILFGEVYCSGVPFGRTPIIGDGVQGEPETTEQMFQGAVALFDEAVGAAAGSTAQQHLAAIGKARALLNLGQYDAAASAVSGVPDDFEYLIRHHDQAEDNGIYSQNVSQARWTVSDNEGINGIPFRSAEDPRLPWMLDPAEVGFDAATPLYRQLKYTSDDDDVVLAGGLEVQLIRAEAALNGGDVDGWLDILNDLRADVDGLDPLEDPGNTEDRVRLHFEERAWWFYGQGYRLGDLRRMVRQYGFAEDDVFPTGDHFKGSAYGNDVNFIIPQDETNNPNFNTCADRSA